MTVCLTTVAKNFFVVVLFCFVLLQVTPENSNWEKPNKFAPFMVCFNKLLISFTVWLTLYIIIG